MAGTDDGVQLHQGELNLTPTAIRFRPGKPKDSYLEMIERLALRRITSDVYLDEALAVVEELMMRQKLNAGESAYFEVLSEVLNNKKGFTRSMVGTLAD